MKEIVAEARRFLVTLDVPLRLSATQHAMLGPDHVPTLHIPVGRCFSTQY